MLRIHKRWHLKTHWCAIPRIPFFLGAIPPSYFGDVRTISSLSSLRHLSYRIFYRRWHTPLCGVRQTWELPWWNCLGALEHDWRPCWRLASRFDGMSMWTTIKCPSVWFATISTSWWCCTHIIYIRLSFVDVLYVSFVMLHLSVRQTCDTRVQWIWW